MPVDVATFTKQIREEGIEAAKQEAEKIINEARTKAQQIIDEANSTIKKMKYDAEKKIEEKLQRSEAELKIIARDIINLVKSKLEEVIKFLLTAKVADILKTEDVLKKIILTIISQQDINKEIEITIGKEISNVIINNILKETNTKFSLKEGLQKIGIEISFKDTPEVVEVSDESITNLIMKYASSELAKILNSEFKSF